MKSNSGKLSPTTSFFSYCEEEDFEEPTVKSKINNWIQHKTDQGHLDEITAMEASRLVIILVSQLKIVSEDQLISHSVGSIRQNMAIPDNLTPLHVTMLAEIFGVREEKRRPPVVSCMGRGYDIVHDEIKVKKLGNF